MKEKTVLLIGYGLIALFLGGCLHNAVTGPKDRMEIAWAKREVHKEGSGYDIKKTEMILINVEGQWYEVFRRELP